MVPQPPCKRAKADPRGSGTRCRPAAAPRWCRRCARRWPTPATAMATMSARWCSLGKVWSGFPKRSCPNKSSLRSACRV